MIDRLKADPDTIVKTYDFYFDFRGVRNDVKQPAKYEEGGSCTFTAALPTRTNCVTVSVVNDGPDYFFPWVPRGVGAVDVPVSAPDGTIVATGQLNGCTFEAIQKGDRIWFYHDGDSKYLRKTVQPVAGTQLCVVAPADYSPGDLGALLMGISQKHADAAKDPTKTRAFCYQLFAVKVGGTWKVYSCGLLLFNGVPTEGFKEQPTKLVATFSAVQASAPPPVRPRAATI
jgi:hypothetical protein